MLKHVVAILMLSSGLGFLFSEVIMAADKCPKPYSPKSFLATTSYYPSTSTTSSSRLSNTSGCQRGTPSDSFYRPKGAIYLSETMELIAEEASQGHGPHLDALAQLVGCEQTPAFSRWMQQNYSRLLADSLKQDNEMTASSLWQRVVILSQHCSEQT